MEVIYEDNHIIVVAKESGEIVQGDKTGDTPLSETVKQYIKEAYAKPGDVFLGVVHRLDRPVSGLVAEPQGTLVHWLVRNEQQNKSYAYDKEVPHSKRAELDYRVIGRSDNYYLLEVNLKTGRHHQIRCQLAKMGCPIKGDLKYGAKRSNPDGSISLQAHSMQFIHPVSKKEILLSLDAKGEFGNFKTLSP